MRYETIKELKATEFKRLTGVKRETYNLMREVLVEKSANFGRPRQLSIEDQLLVALMYWREYRTQFHIAQSYGVSEATVNRIINKVEGVLMDSGRFRLPGRKALYDTNKRMAVMVVDATEQPIERPKKKQKRHYSGKKKRHTQKAQLVIDPQTGQVVATYFGQGRTHDFQIWKDSGLRVQPTCCCLADAGYQGLANSHPNSQTPHKKSKLHPLTPEQQQANRELSRRRIGVEHVIGKLKVFRILSERYRNRRRRFALRFNLLAAIYNFELALP